MITEKQYLEAKKIVENYEREQLNKHAFIGSASKKVKYCRDGKRLCDCMGLICSK